MCLVLLRTVELTGSARLVPRAKAAWSLGQVEAIGGSATGTVSALNKATWCDIFPNETWSARRRVSANGERGTGCYGVLGLAFTDRVMGRRWIMRRWRL